jgi:hypothetical protein
MMRKNKTTLKSSLDINRQKLINKISDAMKIKYNNFFTIAKYDDKSLKDDISKILTTQYYSKDPKDVFKPIESNILDIVKKKNPNLQIKIKKARKLPQIKYSKDKYQESDQLEKEKEKDKGKAKEKEIHLKKAKSTNPNNLMSKEEYKKVHESLRNNSSDNKGNELNNTLRIKEEYCNRHTLVDKLKYKIKYDPIIQYIREDQEKYKKEQEEIKQKKILEQNKYLNDLKSQIEERDKIKEQEKKLKLLELEKIQQHILTENENYKQKQLDEQLKREKLKQNYDKLIQEKDIIKRRKRLEEEIQNKILVEKIAEEINNEKRTILEKKNKEREAILKTQEINEKLAKEKMDKEKEKERQNNNIIKSQNLFESNTISVSNDPIRQRVNNRTLNQEIAGKYLLKIYNTIDKQNQDTYLEEKEKQDKLKMQEYELANKNRQMKLDDYRKSLKDSLAIKLLEKEKLKQEEEKYKLVLEEQYAKYLKEENEKKLKQIEKYENYRKALEEQIKDNKMREIEKMKYKY